MKKSLSSLPPSLLLAYFNSQSLATRKILRKFIGPRGSSSDSSSSNTLSTLDEKSLDNHC
jgi:hypothetical protein